MASLQGTDPGLVTAPDPQPFPAAFPPHYSVGSGGRAPTAPGSAASPQRCPTSRPWCVIPAGATSLLLFPPIDLRHCPSSLSLSLSLRAGWVLQGTAPPSPWERGAPRAAGSSGWHWGAGEWGCRAVPGDLGPGVEVQGPHGAQHLNAPHVLRGEAAEQQRRGEDECQGEGPSTAAPGIHTAAFTSLTPKHPHHTPRPHKLVCATAGDASQGLTTLESRGGIHGPAKPGPSTPPGKLRVPGAMPRAGTRARALPAAVGRSGRTRRAPHTPGAGLSAPSRDPGLRRDLPGQCRRRRAPAPARRGAASPAPVCG